MTTAEVFLTWWAIASVIGGLFLVHGISRSLGEIDDLRQRRRNLRAALRIAGLRAHPEMSHTELTDQINLVEVAYRRAI